MGGSRKTSLATEGRGSLYWGSGDPATASGGGGGDGVHSDACNRFSGGCEKAVDRAQLKAGGLHRQEI